MLRPTARFGLRFDCGKLSSLAALRIVKCAALFFFGASPLIARFPFSQGAVDRLLPTARLFIRDCAWRRRRLWRRLHRLTIFVYALSVAHTIGAGTDASTPLLRWWLLITAPAILALLAARATEPWRRKRRTAAHRPGLRAPGAPTPAASEVAR